MKTLALNGGVSSWDAVSTDIIYVSSDFTFSLLFQGGRLSS
jgi:hypothetical protein